MSWNISLWCYALKTNSILLGYAVCKRKWFKIQLAFETEQWNNIERYCYIRNRLLFSSPLVPLPCNRGKDSTCECFKPKSYYGNVEFSRAELGIMTDDPHEAVCRNSFVAARTQWLPTWHRQPLVTQCNAFSFVKLYGWIKLQATLLCTVQNPLLS